MTSTRGIEVEPPLALLAELTHRCPLRCPYCSNPLELARASTELDTVSWHRVFTEAAALGVLQVHFSGGEPLVRRDLVELVAAATASGLYVNLITSGIRLDAERLARLVEAGLEHVQLSLQDSDHASGNRIAGFPSAQRIKHRVAQLVREAGLPLTVNAVVHRQNLEHLEQIIDLAVTLGADRLEVAHAQYYGWAYRNRSTLMPTPHQVEAAARIASNAAERLRETMQILYVLPDYFTNRPKPCMNGWGRQYLTVTPGGFVLPCPAAWEIAGLKFESVREKPLSWIWEASDSFNRFRGTEWMPEPCRSCPQKTVDFGGCRCQAALLTGDPSNTDPACEFSPYYRLVQQAVWGATDPSVSGDFVFRENHSASVEQETAP